MKTLLEKFHTYPYLEMKHKITKSLRKYKKPMHDFGFENFQLSDSKINLDLSTSWEILRVEQKIIVAILRIKTSRSD